MTYGSCIGFWGLFSVSPLGSFSQLINTNVFQCAYSCYSQEQMLDGGKIWSAVSEDYNTIGENTVFAISYYTQLWTKCYYKES